MADGVDFPTDILVCILQRVQPNARRRLRLVCGYWRQVIDKRTATSLRSRAKTLVVTAETAFVFENLSATKRCGKDFSMRRGLYWDKSEVVGTRNGIICICNPFSGIVLHNLLTCDRLEIPRLPERHHQWGPRTYGFTHDYATGRYMVVNAGFFGRVAVFTLGEASWRDVSTDGWCCSPEDGFVTIDNIMHWVVKVMDGGVNVISLDLDGERPTSVVPVPSSELAGTWSLTEVHGRLGITYSFVSQRLDKTEVWVMKHGASRNVKHAGWSHWYSVQVRHTPRHQPQWYDHQHLTWPHFSHQSDHILTWEWSYTVGACVLYRHKPSNDTRKAERGRVEINERKHGTTVAHIWTEYYTFQTFDYVETMEPLSVYKCW